MEDGAWGMGDGGAVCVPMLGRGVREEWMSWRLIKKLFSIKF